MLVVQPGTMVDFKTAMAAAAADKQKRQKKSADEKKKRRTGANLGIEPFDPIKHVHKERAETASMWLVLGFATTVTLIMRYLLMDMTDAANARILWLLPMSAALLLPQIHRAVMPPKYVEHYTGGTWFKASFLHVFTFLALTFVLVNPPLGDIVAPQIASDWTIVIDDGENLIYPEEGLSGKDDLIIIEITEGNSVGHDAWLLFGLADNVDSFGADVTVEIQNNGPPDTIPMDMNFWEDNYDRIVTLDENNTQTSPELLPHGDLDAPIAINLSDLNVGKHSITVTIEEQGNPWTNTRVLEWEVRVVLVESE